MVINQSNKKKARMERNLRVTGLHSNAICVLFLLKIVSLPTLCAAITVNQWGVSSQGIVARTSSLAVVVPREHCRLLAIAVEDRLEDGDP